MTGSITPTITLGFCAFIIIALTGCTPDYSPNTYNGSAVQQANKVDTGVVVGYREVKISDDGTVGVVTGGAAGGILGAETNSPTVPTALLALGGTVVGGVVGSTLQHATGDTTGWEYIVREPKGDLVSVTQRQPTPIAIGQKVLVIEGKQARIVPDYAAASDTPPAPKADEKHDQDKPAAPVASGSAPARAPTSATPAAAPAAAAAVSPPAPASPPASAPGNAANATPTPLSVDKGQAPSDQPAPASTTAPASSAPPPAQAAPPAAATSPPPPAGAGNGSSPPAPPS